MFSLLITKHFKRQIKPLAKKDPSLINTLKKVLREFNPVVSTYIGNRAFKLRVRRLNTGKSGGYRLYVILFEMENVLSPVCIYSKKKIENISEDELLKHIEYVKIELSDVLERFK